MPLACLHLAGQVRATGSAKDIFIDLFIAGGPLLLNHGPAFQRVSLRLNKLSLFILSAWHRLPPMGCSTPRFLYMIKCSLKGRQFKGLGTHAIEARQLVG